MTIDDKHILDIFVNKDNKVISSRINKKNILKYPDEMTYLEFWNINELKNWLNNDEL